MGLPGAEPTTAPLLPLARTDVTAAAAAAGPPTTTPHTVGAQPKEEPAPVFQPMTLQDAAVRCLSRHLEVFERPRYR